MRITWSARLYVYTQALKDSEETMNSKSCLAYCAVFLYLSKTFKSLANLLLFRRFVAASKWSEDNFPVVEVLKYGTWRSR